MSRSSGRVQERGSWTSGAVRVGATRRRCGLWSTSLSRQESFRGNLGQLFWSATADPAARKKNQAAEAVERTFADQDRFGAVWVHPPTRRGRGGHVQNNRLSGSWVASVRTPRLTGAALKCVTTASTCCGRRLGSGSVAVIMRKLGALEKQIPGVRAQGVADPPFRAAARDVGDLARGIKCQTSRIPDRARDCTQQVSGREKRCFFSNGFLDAINLRKAETHPEFGVRPTTIKTVWHAGLGVVNAGSGACRFACVRV